MKLLNIILLLLVLNSCGVVDSKYAENATKCEDLELTLIPLCVDNWWKYRVTAYELTDTLYTDLLNESSDSMAIWAYTDDREAEGKTYDWFYVSGLIVNPYILYGEHPGLKNGPDGLLGIIRYGSILQTDSVDVDMIAQYPTYEGDSTIFKDYIFITESLDETIVVEGGTFHCIKYHGIHGSVEIGDIWFSPGVGIIKSWQIDYYGHRKVHELVKYSVRTDNG